jgi:dTMP kinase
MFVAIEGIDGAGKTTVRKFLYRLLAEEDEDVLAVQGQSWLAPEHTSVITRAKFHGVKFPPNVLTAATVGDKEALCDRAIRPHRQRRTIIADRWLLSDMVYNCALWDIPMDVTWLAFRESRVVLPDLVIFMNTSPESALRRIGSRPSSRRHRWDSLSTLTSLRDLFMVAVNSFPKEIVVRVDNEGSLGDVCNTVAEKVMSRLPSVAR